MLVVGLLPLVFVDGLVSLVPVGFVPLLEALIIGVALDIGIALVVGVE